MKIEITNDKISIEGESIGKIVQEFTMDKIKTKVNDQNKIENSNPEYIKSVRDNCKYKMHKEHLHSLGWSNKLVILDQNDTNNVCECIKIKESSSTYLIQIIFPMGTKITVYPGYTFGLLILDKDGKEIPDNTKIRIIKDIPSDDISTLVSIFYSDIKMNNGKSGYIFDKGFEINARWHLVISSVPQLDIPKENVMFRLMFDYWTKE